MGETLMNGIQSDSAGAARLVKDVRRSPEPLSWATQLYALKPVQQCLKQGNYSGAVEKLAALGREYPGSSVFACELAALLYNLQYRTQAVAALEAFSRLYPRDHRSRAYLGTIRLQEGDFKAALGLLAGALESGSHDLFTRTNYKYAVRRIAGAKPVQAEKPSYVIATSIPPRDIEESRRALASWTATGAAIHSLNTAEEIELLSPHFDNVHFVYSPRTAKASFGKDYQYLSSILEHLAQQTAQVCAIINSDIILSCEPEDMALLVEQARTTFLFGSRLNVDTAGDDCGRVYERGFDYFLFPRQLAAAIPRTEYCLGMHWWDYAFPWLAKRAGAALAFCYSPVARHVNHPARWNEQMFYDFGMYTAKIMIPEIAALIEQSAAGHIFSDEFFCNMALSTYSSLVGASKPVHCRSECMQNVIAPVDGMRIAVDLLSTNLCTTSVKSEDSHA
jgi:tetratricopeptide (TPR) repeat protein